MAPQQSFRAWADSRPAGRVLTVGNRHWAGPLPRAAQGGVGLAVGGDAGATGNGAAGHRDDRPSNMPQPRPGTWARFPPPGLPGPHVTRQRDRRRRASHISGVRGVPRCGPAAAAGSAATPASLLPSGVRGHPGHWRQHQPHRAGPRARSHSPGPAPHPGRGAGSRRVRPRPRPGQLGPAVIAGHVWTPTGPGVFFRLAPAAR